MTDTSKKWTIALVYLGFIYATLGIVPLPLQYLRSHNLLRLTLGAFFFTCFLLVLRFMYLRTRKAWRFVALFVLLGVYGWLTTMVPRPEEQLHFMEYGLVGVLFLRALSDHVPDNRVAYPLAFVVAVTAGWFDEMLQGRLPNRHYDIRDIYLNAVSAFLGLIAYRLIPRRRETD